MAQYDGSIRINTLVDTKNASAQLMSLENRIVKTSDKIAFLRSKMDALKNAQIPTQEYKSIETDIAKAEAELGKLIEKQAQMQNEGKDSGVAWDRLNQRIQASKDYIEIAREEMQQLVNEEKAFTLGKDTEQYAKLGQQLQYAESEMEALNQKHEAQSLKAEKTENEYKKLGNTAGNALKKIGSIAKESAILSMQRLGSVTKKAASSIKGIASKLFGIGKSSKSASGGVSSMGMGFKNLLKYGLGIRSLYVLVNKIRSAIKEGFSNLYNDPSMASFKNTVDSLRGSLLTLKNAFAAAFQPLAQIAIPYIQKTIQYITALTDKIGQFLAAITGQKTYTKAVRQTAAAFKDTAKETKKAQKAAEGYLSPLDEIIKYSDGKDKDTSSGAGAEAGATGTMFEAASIENSISNFANKIKDFFKNEDWEGFGAYVATGINNGLQKIYDVITWANVGPKITYFTNAFTIAFNSLVDNINWDLLGQTIGAGINTLVNTLTLLIDGINWENIGSGLASALNGLADEVDFTKFGELIGKKFMILPTIALGFVKKLNWSNIGVQIGNGLNGIVNAIDLSKIGELLGRSLIGIFQLAINFSSTFDWAGLGTNIYSGINSFLQNTDFSVIAQGISTFAMGLLTSLRTVIEGIDWGQIVDRIWDFMTGIDYLGLAESLVGVIGAALGAALSVLQELGDLILGFLIYAWDSVVEWWYDTAFEDGQFTIEGLFLGILEALGNLGMWIREHIFQPFIDAFCNAFGIHSPSTVLAEQGKYIISGLLEGLKNNISSVLDWLKNIPKWFKEKFEEAKDKAYAAFDKIGSWFKEKYDDITKVFSNIGSWFKDKFEEAKNKIHNAFSGIGGWFSDRFTDVKNAFNNVGSWFREKFENAYSGVKNAFSNAKNFFSNIWTGIKNAFGNIAGWFRDKFSEAWQAVKNVFSAGGQIFDGIKDGILGGLKTVINALIDGINKVVKVPFDGINGALKSLKKVSIAGVEPFDWLPTISVPQIPKLATGAVIPANREFLAVLGDQKHGTNVEAPLDTIKQALREEALSLGFLGSTGGNGNLTLKVYLEDSQLFNPKKIFEAVVAEGKVQQMSTGKNRLLLET